MSNAELFIEKYKKLEEVVRSTYHLQNSDSISYYLTKQTKYQKYKEDIRYCQEVRNLLSHKMKVSNRYPVEPSQEMIVFIDNLIESIKNRKRCRDVQVGIEKVYWQKITGNVRETMAKMRKEMFSIVPILENGIVTGVFDENSVFNYLSDEEIIEINDGLTFDSIKKYLSLSGREMEKFIFFRQSGYVEDLENEFESSYRAGKRIGIVFLTQNGKSDEKLLGILTPWDILGIE